MKIESANLDFVFDPLVISYFTAKNSWNKLIIV